MLFSDKLLQDSFNTQLAVRHLWDSTSTRPGWALTFLTLQIMLGLEWQHLQIIYRYLGV